MAQFPGQKIYSYLKFFMLQVDTFLFRKLYQFMSFPSGSTVKKVYEFTQEWLFPTLSPVQVMLMLLTLFYFDLIAKVFFSFKTCISLIASQAEHVFISVLFLLFIYLFICKCLFIYLFLCPGLSRSMQDLLVAACGIKFPDQGSNPGPLHWKSGVLATGP